MDRLRSVLSEAPGKKNDLTLCKSELKRITFGIGHAEGALESISHADRFLHYVGIAVSG